MTQAKTIMERIDQRGPLSMTMQFHTNKVGDTIATVFSLGSDETEYYIVKSGMIELVDPAINEALDDARKRLNKREERKENERCAL